MSNHDAPTEATDPDLGKITKGHVCKHGIRWPHACDECDEAAYKAAVLATPTAPVPDDEIHPFEDGEDHNPDGFVHATPEQARVIAEAVERNLAAVQDDDAELVRLLRLFEDAYSSSRGMPWIGTVRPEQAFARAADAIERLSRLTPTAEALTDLRLQALQSELNDPANEYGYAALQKANNALAALAGKQSVEGQGS